LARLKRRMLLMVVRKKSTKSKKSKKARSGLFRGLLLRAFFLLLVAAVGYVVYLDISLRKHFEGKRWALPAHVYARPFELYAGLGVSRDQLVAELTALGYRPTKRAAGPGTYALNNKTFHVVTRAFDYWDGRQSEVSLEVRFDGEGVSALRDRNSGSDIPVLRLEPRLISSISPAHHEDRKLVQLHEVPEDLLTALLVTEDRSFMTHHGVDPRGLIRAVVANLRSRALVQGGSTLTQQLIKNMYLTTDRTLRRKLVEMVMAVLLELHYDKHEILEAYINEVFLAQAGKRAIHGFGLASQYYFGRPISELAVHESALLVGMVKGPSLFEPRRNPERALKRRNLILETMSGEGHIDADALASIKQRDLGVTPRPAASNRYPAFIDLVRRQLQDEYQEEDLRAEGLAVFTTLDANVQAAAEVAVKKTLASFEETRNVKTGTLQAAVVVARVDNGEVVGLVGGRDTGFGGFNRALDASRPIGSLVKPAVYLTALEQTDQFTLSSRIEDAPVSIQQQGAPDWQPQNYDKLFHGEVDLLTALSKSYNVPAVKLGVGVGVENVVDTLHRLGVDKEINPFPSLLLGALELSLLEMTQMYQTLAAGGFRAPMRSILSVLGSRNEPLSRYALSVQQTVDPAPAYLIAYAMQQVVRNGTAKALNKRFDAELALAGKTGTTDGYRDSWFAGFSGNYVAVVWIGRDDNKPVGLSGASGALQIWANMMARLDLQPLNPIQPVDIEWADIDQQNGLLADRGCEYMTNMPFVQGTVPQDLSPCAGGLASLDGLKLPKLDKPIERSDIKRWFKNLFKRKSNGPSAKKNNQKPRIEDRK